MSVEIGQIITGTISGIKSYGVFIKFENTFGFCHISNCSHKFIKNLNELFIINQEVSAKIIEINNDKINVSIKECESNDISKRNKNKENKFTNTAETKEISKPSAKPSFEDMLKNYLKVSDERLESIGKRNQKRQKR